MKYEVLRALPWLPVETSMGPKRLVAYDVDLDETLSVFKCDDSVLLMRQTLNRNTRHRAPTGEVAPETPEDPRDFSLFCCTYRIVEDLGNVGDNLRLLRLSWNGGEPVLDLRRWFKPEKMLVTIDDALLPGVGVTMTEDEAKDLIRLI